MSRPGTVRTEKATLTGDKLKELATMLKGEVATSCPTDSIVGACSAMGIAEQYYSPKYTRETGKKACKGVWKE